MSDAAAATGTVTKTCRVCGVRFSTQNLTNVRGRYPLYCSDGCRREAALKRRRDLARARRAAEEAEEAEVAGVPEVPTPGARQPHHRGDPVTGERYYDEEETAFLAAVERFRREWKRIPTCCELLAVAKALGYRRVAPPGPGNEKAPGGP